MWRNAGITYLEYLTEMSSIFSKCIKPSNQIKSKKQLSLHLKEKISALQTYIHTDVSKAFPNTK